MPKQLEVWLFDAHVGTLAQIDGRLGFTYAPDWLANNSATPLSQSLPLQAAPFDDRATRPFFAGLLPEGDKRKGVAQALHVSRQNDFALLDGIGGECAGAVTLLEPGQTPQPLDAPDAVRWLDAAELVRTIDEMPSRPMRAGDADLRLSLAGAQDKLPVVAEGGRIGLPRFGTPSTHILKPAIPGIEASVLNEGFCMALAAALKLDVAMNKAKLKTYAPQARKDFIAAVEARAHSLGLSEKGGTLDIAPSEKKGDVAVIAGQAWPAKVHDQRERLIKRMKKDGFAQTVEAVAYTWFNRFAALRYMEIHDYLGHGYRVLSSREGGLPEILATPRTVALPGLNAADADMKLAGNQDGELYRLLLVAQCNALSKAMPFLFERIDDESELLLPDNLERTDSVVAKLVGSRSPRKTGTKSRSSAGCTSSTSARRRTRSSARW
jgi:HipA-like protein